MENQLEHAPLGQAGPEQPLQRGQGFGAGKGQRGAFPEHTQTAIPIEVDVEVVVVGQIVQVGGERMPVGHPTKVSLLEMSLRTKPDFFQQGNHGFFSLTSVSTHWACSISR